MTIVLKDLSRRFDVDPYPMRMFLRSRFGKHARWKWESEQDPEYQQVISALSEKFGKNTSTSPTSSQTTPSRPSRRKASSSPSTK